MVPIFDTCINIRNREGFKDCDMDMIDALHSMLTDMEVPHAFVFADAAEVERINSSGYEYCCSLMYRDEDKLMCEMVYVLWNKLYRNAPVKNICGALSIIAGYAPI